MNIVFEMNDENLAYFAEDELPEYDSCGRRTTCYFYKNVNGNPNCRALTDFYNVENEKNQCGNCPFYKTEKEFKEGWDGGTYYEEDEFEEAV